MVSNKILTFDDETMDPPKGNSLDEIYQSSSLRFSMGKISLKNKEAYQMTQWCKCRDFLCDTVLATVDSDYTSVSIFGYEHNGDTHRLPRDGVYLFVKGLKSNRLEYVISFLNALERSAKWKQSVVYPTSEDNHYVFVGSKRWLSPFYIWLYSFLIRLSHEHGDNNRTYGSVSEEINHWLETQSGGNDYTYLYNFMQACQNINADWDKKRFITTLLIKQKKLLSSSENILGQIKGKVHSDAHMYHDYCGLNTMADAMCEYKSETVSTPNKSRIYSGLYHEFVKLINA